jgi:flavin reductase (DIM6/NTAB) family NADH-FMN oxidoreductase RutF
MSRRPIQPTIRTHANKAAPEEGLGSDTVREALSYWASGVAILAVSDGDEIDAITVSAFSAVSLDPPLVLVCVNEQSSILPMLLEESRFTVNVLTEDMQRTGSAVAQRLPSSLAGFRTEGDPVLEGSLVSFVCRLWEAYPGGDHRIVVGEVERVELGPDAQPLLYFRRMYRGMR